MIVHKWIKQLLGVPEKTPSSVVVYTPTIEETASDPFVDVKVPRYCERCSKQLFVFKESSFDLYTAAEQIEKIAVVCPDKSKYSALYADHTALAYTPRHGWYDMGYFIKENYIRIK